MTPDASEPAAAASDRPDIRLVAVDMDGTLLDGDGHVPDGLWPLLERMRERGIGFAPASGRQLATLQRAFGAIGGDLDVIAENGAYVVHGGVEVSSDTMDDRFTASLVRRLRELAGDIEIGTVVCGKQSAYIERADAAFRREAAKYYARLEIVDDLLAVEDQVLKVAVYDFEDAERLTVPALEPLQQTHQVVLSGHHWVDVMNLGVNKGVALRQLQEALGVTRAQTAAFGDYLNDIELLRAADWSYAMAEAHPDVVAVARHRAPSHRDHGVVTVLEQLLA